jgi:two-component system, NtrC family, response regulator HydG
MRKDLPTGLIVGPTRGRTPLLALLRQAGFAALQAGDGAAAARALRESRVDCVITRLSAPRLDGFQVLALARERHPAAPVVVFGDRIDPETEAALYAQGADDVQQGAWHRERLAAVLRRALERAALERRASELEERLDRRYRTDPLTGASPAIQRVVDQIRHVAPTRAMVLIEGERGAGKSRVARAIHHGSPRREGPFVRVSLGALSADQAEAELFGDSGGLERADHGTLFLDEIDRAAPALQARLLSEIRGREGGRSDALGRRLDVRMLAATDRDLAAQARAGRFLPDLWERLGAVRIAVPSLRDRREDLPLLVERFVQDANRAHARRIGGITQGALERLASYGWPGNVAELRDRVEAMVLAAHGRRRLDLSDLPDSLRGADRASARDGAPPLAAGMTVEEAERHLIADTLRHTGGHKPRAAAMLGIGLRTLYRKIRQYRLEPGGEPRR